MLPVLDPGNYFEGVRGGAEGPGVCIRPCGVALCSMVERVS